MTRFLRFVKSAHFFAFAIACIFGVFFITVGGNVWAGTLSSSDPCYGKYYTGPGGGSISCNYEDNMGKCFQVSNGVCQYWCKNSYYFRAVDSGSITSSSQITSNMAWTCQGGTNLTGSCGTQKTSYDGQTYYQNESYLDCRKTISIGSDAYPLSGQSSAYVEFKINPDRSYDANGNGYVFDVKAGKSWNPYALTDSYPSWIYNSRGYRCGAGTRVNSSAQLCPSGSYVGRISGSSCSTSSSVISAQPYCTACANGTYNSGYTASTSCTTVPENSTASSDKTTFVCNTDYIKFSDHCSRCPYGGATNPLTSPSSNVQNDSYFTVVANGINHPNDSTWELAEPGRSSNGTSCSIEYTGSDTTGTYSTGSCTLDNIYMAGYGFFITIGWYGYQGADDDFAKYRSLVCSNFESTQPRNQGEGYCVNGYYGMGYFYDAFETVFPGCYIPDESDLFFDNNGAYGLTAYCNSAYATQFFLAHLYTGGQVFDFYID